MTQLPPADLGVRQNEQAQLLDDLSEATHRLEKLIQRIPPLGGNRQLAMEATKRFEEAKMWIDKATTSFDGSI
ncbi:hypothetical protein [Paludibacterium denitrificans]|uniref:Acb2/Tad1 hairpin domain-containing protein n=1 Tax=Paludibacterium denitrificans TaxID=2675226 RepID=A0A844GCN7_9NEIS|nr:hypothetical protein [Paludibacterium denitrificans]MTD32534.1 hypothetical protein [Paludibacterium denitrificans]